MVGKCLRIALVGLFGAPHCGGRDTRSRNRPARCRLSPAERKRLYIKGKPCPCRLSDPPA